MAVNVARRKFVAGLGGTALAWPLAARAQQPDRIRQVGLLSGGVADDTMLQTFVAAFRDGLQKLGWVDGQNIRIDERWAAADPGRMRAYAVELVAMGSDVILSDNTPIVQELRRQTRTIPIVFVSLADPVASGVVASLAHPDSNTTGFMNPEASMSVKWLELLKEIAPSINEVLVMVNAGNVGNAGRLRVIETAVHSFGVRISSSAIHDASDIESAIDAVAHDTNVGLIVMPAAPINDLRKIIFELAARHRLPAVYPYRYYAVDGGLMSYGAEPLDMWSRAASYVDRILKGEKPSNLPVQAPTKYQLVVNLKTAKALDLTVPPTLLARADEVIE
jgi:putative tryptophan/tyrosine transport system substrate-binding protein